MAGAALGKAYIEVRADLDAFPAELREKLKLALAEATQGVKFDEAEVNMKKAGEGLADDFADSVDKEVEPRSKKSGEKAGKSFFSGLKGIFPVLRAAFLPTLIAFAVELGAYLAPAVGALAAAIPGAAAVAVGAIAPLIVAFKGVGTALAGAFSSNATPEQLAALQALTPAAKGFVIQLMGVRDQLKAMKTDAQQAFFQALNPGLKQALTLVPILRTYFGQFAGDLGKFAGNIASTLGSNSSGFESILLGIHAVLGDLAPLGSALTRIFINLAAVSLPFIDTLTRGFVRAVQGFSDFIDRATASGGLANFFSGALIILHDLGQALLQVSGLIGAIVGGLASSGGNALGFLTETLRDLNAFFSTAQGKATLASVFGLLNQLLQSLHDILVPLLPLIGELITDFAGGLTDALKAITPLLQATAEFLAKHPDLVKAAIAAWASYRIALLLVAAAEAIVDALDPATWIVLAVAAIVAAAILIIVYWDKIKAAALDAWHAVLDAGKAVWNWLKDAAVAVGTFFGNLIQFFQDLPGKIANFIASIPHMLYQLFLDAADQVGYAIGYLIGTVISELIQLPGQILSALQAIPGLLRDLWHMAVAWVEGEINLGEQFLVDFFVNMPLRIAGWLAGLPGTLRRVWNDAFAQAKDEVVKGGEGILNWVSGLPRRLAGFFSDVGSSIVHGLRDAFNNVIRSINHGIDDAAGPLHTFIPHIPYLANGAIINSPTLAMVGESAPEVVIPLSRPDRAKQLADQSGLTQILMQGLQAANVQLTVLAMLDTGDFIRIIDTRVTKGLSDEASALATNSKSGGF